MIQETTEVCISELIFLFTFNSLYDMENKIKFCLLDGKANKQAQQNQTEIQEGMGCQ